MSGSGEAGRGKIQPSSLTMRENRSKGISLECQRSRNLRPGHTMSSERPASRPGRYWASLLPECSEPHLPTLAGRSPRCSCPEPLALGPGATAPITERLTHLGWAVRSDQTAGQRQQLSPASPFRKSNRKQQWRKAGSSGPHGEPGGSSPFFSF